MTEHYVNMRARNTVEIGGVTNVVGFDSESLVLDTTEGRLTIEGRELCVSDLSVSDGKIGASGQIIGMQYTKVQNESGKGFFSRIFK